MSIFWWGHATTAAEMMAAQPEHSTDSQAGSSQCVSHSVWNIMISYTTSCLLNLCVAFALTFLHISSGVLETQKLNILVCNMLPQVLTRVSRILFWPCLCHCDLGMGRQRVGHTPRCVPHYSQTWKTWRCDHQTRSFSKKTPQSKLYSFCQWFKGFHVSSSIFSHQPQRRITVFFICDFIFSKL